MNNENWILCRKPLQEKTVADNVLKWGTGGINIDGSRVDTDDEIKTQSLLDIRGKDLQGNRKDGLKPQRLDKLYVPSPEGRFPANFIYCGDDEVLEEFSKAGVSKSGSVKNVINNGPSNNINIGGGILKKCDGSEGLASRFFFDTKE